MAVARRDALAMLDLDHVAVAAGIARVHDLARGGGAHDRAFLGAQIDAGMKRPAHAEGIFPCAVRARDLELAAERLAQRQQRDHSRQFVMLFETNLETVQKNVETPTTPSFGSGRKGPPVSEVFALRALRENGQDQGPNV